MTMGFAHTALIFVFVLGSAAHGQTLRWATQGDTLTMDPH